MKKVFAFILVISLLLMTTVCVAENNTKLYEDYMKGTWELDSMSILAKSNMFNDSSFSTITFPRMFCFITGDETGKVYATMNAGFSYLRAEITFTSDFKTMVLIDEDGSRIILKKK